MAMTSIRISSGAVSVRAELDDNPTAARLVAALPITGEANRWGEEVYFEVPVEAPLAPTARADVEVGELGYWPPGRAFCIFFGPTPVSRGSKPRAYSPVNVIGRVVDDATAFRAVSDGAEVRLTRE
jgi:hypothetical protein